MKRTPKPRDAAQRAWAVVAEATGQVKPAEEKDPVAVERGRKGGQSRVHRLTDVQRSEDARHAANVRWGNVKEA